MFSLVDAIFISFIIKSFSNIILLKLSVSVNLIIKLTYIELSF